MSMLTHIDELMCVVNISWDLNKLYSSAICCAHDIEIMNIMYKQAFPDNVVSLVMIKTEIRNKIDIIDKAIELMETELGKHNIDDITTEKIRESVNELKEFVEREKEKHNFDFSPDPLPPVILPTSKNDN